LAAPVLVNMACSRDKTINSPQYDPQQYNTVVYTGQLVQINPNKSFYAITLKSDSGSMTLERTVKSSAVTLEEKLIGTWMGGMGTDDYPSSHIETWKLELLENRNAVYSEEIGHEEFEGGVQGNPTIYVIDENKGPYRGTWNPIEPDSVKVKLHF